jgi:aspartyl-tRNA(Asn)/glutamyl-tRNA(Gln) amidotransferase subunit A
VGLFAGRCDDLKFVIEEVGLFDLGTDALGGGQAARDMTCVAEGAVSGSGSGSGPLDVASIKVGVIRDFEDHPVTKRAVEALEKQNIRTEVVPLETYSHGLPAYYILALSEASSNLSRFDGIRYGDDRNLFSSEVKRRILMGTYALSAGYYDAYYKKAQQVRTLVTEEMEACLREYDFLISPVAPTGAYKLGEKTEDPLEMYKGDLMTVNVNLSGLPAVSVPFLTGDGEDGGMPQNIQVIGRRFDELRLLEFGSLFEGYPQ